MLDARRQGPPPLPVPSGSGSQDVFPADLVFAPTPAHRGLRLIRSHCKPSRPGDIHPLKSDIGRCVLHLECAMLAHAGSRDRLRGSFRPHLPWIRAGIRPQPQTRKDVPSLSADPKPVSHWMRLTCPFGREAAAAGCVMRASGQATAGFRQMRLTYPFARPDGRTPSTRPGRRRPPPPRLRRPPSTPTRRRQRSRMWS